jgi:DNA-binding MarR family transcriptional regulator
MWGHVVETSRRGPLHGPYTGSVAGRRPSHADQHSYFVAIARARSVVRRVVRLVDEQAKRFELEPLEHQTLIQVYGSEDHGVQMRDLAERLDISAPHASRLVSALEDRGLVAREDSADDLRATIVSATRDGADLLRDIDAEVRVEIAHFQRQLRDSDRFNALWIFTFYVGMETTPEALAKKLGRR